MMQKKEIEYGSRAYRQTLDLRQKILREPLGLELSKKDKARDPENIILGVFSKENALVACVYLQPVDRLQIQLRQMAVDTAFQNRGIGRELLSFAEEKARSGSYRKIVLHARKVAVGFYKKSGYKIAGDVFEEVGIPHYSMYKVLEKQL